MERTRTLSDSDDIKVVVSEWDGSEIDGRWLADFGELRAFIVETTDARGEHTRERIAVWTRDDEPEFGWLVAGWGMVNYFDEKGRIGSAKSARYETLLNALDKAEKTARRTIVEMREAKREQAERRAHVAGEIAAFFGETDDNESADFTR